MTNNTIPDEQAQRDAAEAGTSDTAMQGMRMMDDEYDHQIPAILFDVDGLLISTGGAGTKSWRYAFEQLHGIPADIGEFTEGGMTDPTVGREPTDREMARLLAAYLDRLGVEVEQSSGYRVMPGVASLLPWLTDAGILLGIVSGALEAATHIKLARGGLNRFFCFGGYGSDSSNRAELTRLAIERAGRIHGHPLDAARLLVVGDTPRDIDAAHAAGAIAVGVATGKYTVEALRSAGADHVLATLEEPLPGVTAAQTRSGRLTMPVKKHVIPDERAQEVAAAKADRMAEPFTLVLFGASGDLTQRMVMPAIFRLARRGLLSPAFRLIGYARSKMTDDEFRARMRKAVMREPGVGDKQAWPEFAARLSYIAAEYDGDDLQGYAELARRFEQLDRGTGAGARRLFYLATPPALFAPIMEHLSDAKLASQAHQPAAGGWARFVIEKPFGHDLASARALNADIARRFAEHDIYRIDHFLGKEIVQNLFALRFANGIFEPVWNRNYIDHVQITATETLGMEGRGSYYETAGAVRDMVQNHLLQLCALVAIEPPAAWNSRAVRDEKVKVLRAVRRIVPGEVERDAVRGQYGVGSISGERVPAYREEAEVAADSPVETYAALRLHIDNVRWAGVPFYLRSGKRLANSATEIVVEFKPAPHTPWSVRGAVDGSVRPNLLVVNVSPQEGIIIRVEAKRPGQAMRLQSMDLDYCRRDERSVTESPSAYEHLLLDSLRGDPTFFARADEVEAAWEIVEPVIESWELEKSTDFPNYAAGSSGPSAADELLARDGRRWYGSTDQAEC